MLLSLDTSQLLANVQQYGSGSLFLLLALGIIGLPIPDETLLLLAGVLAASNKLPLITAWLATVTGAMAGITTSYILGRTLGHFTVIKLLKFFKIKDTHWQYAHDWFLRVGKWLLVIGYFIPGVRHFTGLIAGTTELPTKQFMLYAYSGALIWSNLFFWLGYFYGLDTIHFIMDNYDRYGAWILLPVCILLIAFYLFKRKN